MFVLQVFGASHQVLPCVCQTVGSSLPPPAPPSLRGRGGSPAGSATSYARPCLWHSCQVDGFATPPAPLGRMAGGCSRFTTPPLRLWLRVLVAGHATPPAPLGRMAGGWSRHAACSSGSHGWWLVTPRRRSAYGSSCWWLHRLRHAAAPPMAPRAGGWLRHAACSSGSHGWWLASPRRRSAYGSACWWLSLAGFARSRPLARLFLSFPQIKILCIMVLSV